MTTGIVPLRPFTGWFRLSNPSKRKQLHISSAVDFDIDLWNLVEYYSEVEDVGLSFIQSKSLPTQKTDQEIFAKFRAFMRQARANFDGAKALPYRSSGLLYYYCFLNLVKAYILLHQPDRVFGRVMHGLSYNPDSGNLLFEDEFLSVHDGVFRILYDLEVGQAIATTSKLYIVDILGYCSDILSQYESASFGRPKHYSGISTTVMDSLSMQAWVLWGLDKRVNLQKDAPDIFSKVILTFDPIEIDSTYGREIFEFPRGEWASFNYYQSKSTVPFGPGGTLVPSTILDSISEALYPHYSVNYYKNSIDFHVTLKTNIGSLVMNELLSTYSVMFYLSSLVRYRPDYLELILTQKAAWIISGFVNSCVHTFLRSMFSRIIDKEIILSRR